jgi:hypothetical protein
VRGRFPFATLMSIVAAALLFVAGEVLWGVVFLVIAAFFGMVTLRSAR